MSQSQTPQVDVQLLTFGKQALEAVESNRHASDNWPIVYILSDKKTKTAYVGETTNTRSVSIKGVALREMIAKHARGPLAETGGSQGTDPVPHGYNGIEVIVLEPALYLP